MALYANTAREYTLDEFNTENSVCNAGGRTILWERTVVGIQKDSQTGELWRTVKRGNYGVVFKDNLEDLIMSSFRGVIAKLHEDRKTGILQVPCLMRGRSALMDDGSVAGEVVTFLEVVEQNLNAPHAVLCPFSTVRMYCFIISHIKMLQCNHLATTY